ncbi:DUF4177 domain-containing protein [Shimia abyssi]|uniref:DUF4177 domain-containing protein n=1 Tax=Shimia abyssi TaxID=1662395 RepID=A0A2P8FJJ7_9RHOB|nr:hypothetical protein CLV88_101331 [Shimia abyssi]
MTTYDYKVVPAPTKGRKAKHAKGPEGRFANALELLMNDMATDGWEFQRAETLPSEERSGLTSSTTTYRSVMIFRRPRAGDTEAFAPIMLDTPKVVELPAPETPKDVKGDKDEATVQLAGPAEATPEHAGEAVAEGEAALLSETKNDVDATIATAPKSENTEQDIAPPEPIVAPLILSDAERRKPDAVNDPEDSAVVSDISIALKARAQNLSKP